MGQFLYLLPGKGPAKALVENYGLADRIGPEPTPRGLPEGIGIKDGKLCHAREESDEEIEAVIVGLGKKLGFFPEQQTWERVELPDVEPYWIGWFTGDVPEPDGLVRDPIVNGHMVEMGDGKEWLIPIARSFREGVTCLPENLRMGASGELERHVKASYRALFERASEIAGQAYNQGYFEIDEEEGFVLAVDALAVNYRVSIAEVNALGLMDTQTRHAVLRALIDGPTYEAIVKMLEDRNADKAAAKQGPEGKKKQSSD